MNRAGRVAAYRARDHPAGLVRVVRAGVFDDLVVASAREIVSMIGEITCRARGPGTPGPRRASRRPRTRRPGVLRVERGELLLEVLGHLEPDAEHQPHVVQRPQPVPGLVAGEPDLAALRRQRLQQRLGEVLLGLAQGRLGVLAELARRLRVIAVGVGQQPGEHRVDRQLRAGSSGSLNMLLQLVEDIVDADSAAPAAAAGRRVVQQLHDRDDQGAQQRRLARGQPDA